MSYRRRTNPLERQAFKTHLGSLQAHAAVRKNALLNSDRPRCDGPGCTRLAETTILAGVGAHRFCSSTCANNYISLKAKPSLTG